MASCGDGPDRDRCLDLELDPELELDLDELDELEELTLNIFEILLIFKLEIKDQEPTCLKYTDTARIPRERGNS